jgi:hypothetical protein
VRKFPVICGIVIGDIPLRDSIQLRRPTRLRHPIGFALVGFTFGGEFECFSVETVHHGAPVFDFAGDRPTVAKGAISVFVPNLSD